MNNFCDDVNVLNVMKVINVIIGLVKIIIPIILIVLIIIEFSKAIVGGKEDDIKIALSNSIKKFIAAVIVFLVPTIVYAVFNSINVDNSIINCFKNGNSESIAKLYIDKSRELIDKLYSNLNEDDYYVALKYVSKIKDEIIKEKYTKELELFKKELDYNNIVIMLANAKKKLYLSDSDENFIEEYLSNNNNQNILNSYKVVKNYSDINKAINELINNYDADKFNELEDKINNVNDSYVKDVLLDKLNNISKYEGAYGPAIDYKGEDTKAGGHKISSCDHPNIKSYDLTNLPCQIYYGSKYYERNKIEFNAEVGDELVDILISLCTYVSNNKYIDKLQDDGFYVGRQDNGTDYHAKGLAVDLNDHFTYNGHSPYSSEGKATWERYKKFICEECNGNENCDKNVNYQIFHQYFEGKGWCWGGNWGPESFDPMHFEYRGGCTGICLTSGKQQITCD